VFAVEHRKRVQAYRLELRQQKQQQEVLPPAAVNTETTGGQADNFFRLLIQQS